jgi:hypothetical protein
MKMDLIIDNTYNTLSVSDFHLTPISNNMPYTYKSDEYIIGNTHQDNIKNYFNDNKGHFYKSCLDSTYLHNWPIICNENDVITSYSNIYDMGCKRTNSYNKYKKQFEFFCPLWLEHAKDIKFVLSVYDNLKNICISTNELNLTTGDNHSEYHNKFVKYINDYLLTSGICNGDDNLLNIQFNKNIATISGLNVSNGLFETNTIYDLVENITNRERPVMEVDNMLISSLSNNNIIAKQLFNFNLCFNIDDILSGHIAKLMKGENLHIKLDVYVDDELLSKKDFYTDYEYIPKELKSTSNSKVEIPNVLDYLHDYECVDLIDKNKFCQSTCHWSLFDNPNYIFNVYEGFSGVHHELENNEDIFYENEHQYGLTPNTFIKIHDKTQNSIGWLNVYNVTYWDDFYKYIKQSDLYKRDANYVGISNYVNNIRYSYKPERPFYLMGLNVTDENTYTSILNTYFNSDNTSNYFEIIKYKLYALLINNDDYNGLIIITNDINCLSFNVFYNELTNNLTNNADLVSELHNMLKNIIEPSLIVFNKSLTYTTSNNPSNDATEVTYYKDNSDKAYNYVFRYDGKLLPMFIDVNDNLNNTLYYKDYVSNDDNKKLIQSVYANYNNDTYEPLYPSINYCAIKKLNGYNYNELPNVMVTEHENPVSIYDNTTEYSWFDDNICLIMNPKIEFVYKNTKEDGYEKLDNIVSNYLSTYYNATGDKLTYIKNLYNYTNNWEYDSISNIDDYVYNIVLTLK